MIPLYRILLYFPQAHSKSLLVQNSFTEKITLRFVRTVVDRLWLQTSPLDSFKIDSGEASPIDILLNLLQDSYLYYYSYYSS
jgi:hypothetical protein